MALTVLFGELVADAVTVGFGVAVPVAEGVPLGESLWVGVAVGNDVNVGFGVAVFVAEAVLFGDSL